MAVSGQLVGTRGVGEGPRRQISQQGQELAARHLRRTRVKVARTATGQGWGCQSSSTGRGRGDCQGPGSEFQGPGVGYF